jgi:hypothetical protein
VIVAIVVEFRIGVRCAAGLYFDNRFAHDLALLFHVANMLMRHAVNRAVNAKVMTRPERRRGVTAVYLVGD